MGEDKLKIEGLSCGYGDKEIIRAADFVVNRGDFVGIIGPNASGKTTLLRTINRVLEPQNGSIYLDGEDIGKLDKKKVARYMAAVPQEFTSNYSFSALEMVTLGRTPHLGPLEAEGEEDMAVVRESMEMTNTWNLHSRDFSELSGGEKQRVIIAKALAQQPTVLLLDEPTNHLDINNQMEILDLLKDLTRDEKKCVIVTFHDLNTAARYCDSLILLYKEEIYAKGTPEEVLTESNVKEVYGTDVLIRRQPETSSISVTPMSGNSSGRGHLDLSVHLVCGGGTGKELMYLLTREGYQVSAGVLSPMDDDYREAKRLGLQVAWSDPFLPIGEETLEYNKKLVDNSDFVILTDMPIGKGNLKNLELTVQEADDKPVIVIEKNPIEERDFTEGEAKELYSSLKNKCARTVERLSEVVPFLRKYDFREKEG